MSNIALSKDVKQKAQIQLQDEINDYTIYKILSEKTKDEKNKKIFMELANEEKAHYEFCKKITNEDRKAKNILFYLSYFA